MFVLYVFEFRTGGSFTLLTVNVIVDVTVTIVSVTVTSRGKLVWPMVSKSSSAFVEMTPAEDTIRRVLFDNANVKDNINWP